MPTNLLRALVHSGNFVCGAFIGDRLVGAGVGWLGQPSRTRELHSHVVGVARDVQGSGVGLAIKIHQRDWARARDIPCVTWTFDPLGRRNGWFNLGKLGAVATSYHPNFYGPMVDELNGSDDTDRCFVRWDVTGDDTPEQRAPRKGPPRHRAPGQGASGPARLLLACGPGDRPEPVVAAADAAGTGTAAGAGGPVPALPGANLGCQVPPDIVELRRADPALARRWRVELRATMGAAMADGYVAAGMTRDGTYILERRGNQP
jgi:predicted GNAT superfamily acetyltransferase